MGGVACGARGLAGGGGGGGGGGGAAPWATKARILSSASTLCDAVAPRKMIDAIKIPCRIREVIEACQPPVWRCFFDSMRLYWRSMSLSPAHSYSQVRCQEFWSCFSMI